MTIFGIDLSDYDSSRGNSPATVAKYRGLGIAFLTHKSTESAPGQTFRHTRIGPMLTAGRDSGIPFLGGYVVPRTGVAVGTQGANHVAFLDSQIPWWRTHPGFFHQVDLERWPYDSVAASVGNQLVDWLRVNGAGKPVVLYGSKGQYGSSELRSPRWNANYPINTAKEFKALYAASGGDSGPGWDSFGSPARPAEIWQYASTAIVAGQGTTDVNAFRGTEAQFAQMLGISPTNSTTTPTKGKPMDRIAAVKNPAPANVMKWYFGNGLRYREIVTWPEHESLIAGGAVEKAFNYNEDWQGYVGRILDTPESVSAPATVEVTQEMLNAAVAANIGAIASALAGHVQIV